MGPAQIVFLFDLNACVDYLSRPKEELSKILLSIRLACLRLLSDFAAKSPNTKWGFKFFDSCGSKTQIMCRFSFPDLSLENFESFENDICVRYERHLSILQAYMESSKDSGILSREKTEEESIVDLPVKILQLALTQSLCEFQWETMEMWSPSSSKIKNRKKNFLFVFSNFRDNNETLKYFGLNNLLSKSKFLNLFLPQSLRDSILKKADINLVFINICQDQKFLGSSSTILSVLADSLCSIQGSLVPLNILSQPLYNISLLEDSKRSTVLSDMPCTYLNSFIPFSAVFEQSLHNPFYSVDNSSVSECIIEIPSQNLQIPIKIIEIMNKEDNLKTASTVKNKCEKDSKNIWSKFTVQCAVSRNVHFPAYKSILCLPNSKKGKMEESSNLSVLNQTLCMNDINLFLECETQNCLKIPGVFIALSSDTAAVSILDPAINFPNLAIDFAVPVSKSLTNKNSTNDHLMKISTFIKKETDLLENHQTEVTNLKPFYMECLDVWFKPKKLSNVASYIESKSSKKDLESIEMYRKLLKESVKRVKNSKSKNNNLLSGIPELTNSVDQAELKQETLQNHQSNPESETNDLEELASDLNYEELLSRVKDTYESAVEMTGNIVSASKQIMKMMTKYCKKNSTFFEESVNKILKENFLMSDKKIIEKYAMSDSVEATEKKIKECQMQILLILEVESLKISPDKTNCVNAITSLLRLATFCYSQKELLQLEGLKELKTFLEEVIKKNYSHTLYDILVEIGDECVQIFDDSESSGSPAETISSEFNNEDDLFSSVISSAMSEKSTSSTGSRKDCKDNKERSGLGRKLIRRRSDLSETSKYRQVLLPKSSPKKKKAKRTANAAVRCSPRLATKRNDRPAKPVCENNKARRNLFSGEKSFHTPKKSNYHPSTPKSKKKNNVMKNKLAAETPSHKQNYSALERRKSFIDPLSQSPKVIAESPTIQETVKDNACKEFFEKLKKTSQEASNLSNKTIEEKPRLPSLKECTPESKRRLSLKFFSKFFNSPTARMGIKKCTKRLFDQISPQKTADNCKRQKLFDE